MAHKKDHIYFILGLQWKQKYGKLYRVLPTAMCLISCKSVVIQALMRIEIGK